ncbi:cysteinyl-tRNA synthetase [Isoptericola sp. CG 20/1183]|uniref:Cysteine--tRNA ligase n=1 Tax=Isoptericola halotolerans TaxID=300560 RepID=A0ABX5EHZ7_9MICO|nr:MULTISPECIES: cysteine--tRNA ligase [Isoptericola]PRZ08159.1 cysteinyl-tRNA synthetase [Isoptericola halotolerans]PRZ08956.1 cysteinyl-tRNA synthetase [Isoptericola sp. CG 20/1183]
MTLHLYDTATRTVRELVPRTPGKVGIYLCGATVQSSPHVGHLRPAVAFDVLRRWLRRKGLDVTLIRNVTDIDDKILTKAAAAGVEWWAHAAVHEREFTAAYDALGVLPPTYEPRATGHVPQMIDLMERLVESGHAYATGPGNVWFDVRSWPAYGELTTQRLEDLNPESTDDAATTEKRDPHDFALWKASRPGEPETAAWDTPFGRGRPGWHLECSAMAHRYLGESFDIHGGGLDLRFPHHENEQAQSRAAGYGFADRWMHSAWVTQQGVKMSKSLGNGLLMSEVLAKAPAPVVRYALAAVQYRSMLEWGPDTLDEARNTWERLVGFVARATERVGDVSRAEVATSALPPAFEAAMDDDLNVPAALAVVHETLRSGNTALAAADDDGARRALVALRGMLDVLGLDPADPLWAAEADTKVADALDAVVRAELEARAAARAAKDWATSDAIRDRLAAAGVVVQDSPDGARWALSTTEENS